MAHGQHIWWMADTWAQHYTCIGITVWCWDTCTQCFCDTLTWLPANLPIPKASASDYIIAGLHDITQVLYHPSKHSLLAPLTSKMVDALELMKILHRSNKLALEPEPKHLPTAPSLRVGLNHTQPKHVHPNSAPPLRVVTNQPCMISLTPDPSKVPHPMDISTNATVGMDNWAAPQLLLHVPQQIICAMTKPCCSHCHAANLTNAQPNPTPDFSLHGNAFNPDMGELAKYKELSNSSDGLLWQASNATVIHQLVQGHGTTPGTTPSFHPCICHPPTQEGNIPTHCLCPPTRKGTPAPCQMDCGR